VATPHAKPTIKDLGLDLLHLSPFQLMVTIALPFFFFALYFAFAFSDRWVFAFICTIALSFFSYGSTSHDLVHENLELDKTINMILLTVLELICFRSGHAYKLSHLYHHKRFPHEDDIEGSAARMSLVRSMLEGIIFQPKLYFWAIRNYKGYKYYRLVIVEGIAVAMLISFCIYSLSFTYVYFVYMCLMITGSWLIPLITSYAVHSPDSDRELTQTRLFRGVFFSLISVNHLFHLEHHLYPMVPHKNWPKLARRLDNYFNSEGIEPVKLTL